MMFKNDFDLHSIADALDTLKRYAKMLEEGSIRDGQIGCICEGCNEFYPYVELNYLGALVCRRCIPDFRDKKLK